MAYIPRSSLIPNETSGAIPVQMKKKRTIHAFGLIAMILFTLSLLAAVGVFVYKDLLEKRLEEAQAGLGAVSSEDSRKSIEEVRIYHDKLRVAENLLDNHIAPSLLFEEIENSTKKTVQFQSLEFVHDPGFEAMITLGGNTKEFSSLALQKMQLFEDSFLSQFVIQDISTSESVDPDAEEEEATTRDGIGFKVVGVFRKELLDYSPENRNDAAPTESSLPLEARETGTTTESIEPTTP